MRKRIMLLMLLLLSSMAFALNPSAPDSMDITENNFPVEPGLKLNTSGGSISTVTINETTNDYRWKGFVGNITGEYSLQDGSSNSLYDWDISTITGEIYATRESGLIDWSSITCAPDSLIRAEQDYLNMTSSMDDNINRTFNDTTHDEFYAGTVQVPEDSCSSVALNVNGERQDTDFQEVLLTDGASLIYAALLEDSKQGFDSNLYDFQMIVADNALEGKQPNTPYYFYVELI